MSSTTRGELQILWRKTEILLYELWPTLVSLKAMQVISESKLSIAFTEEADLCMQQRNHFQHN